MGTTRPHGTLIVDENSMARLADFAWTPNLNRRLSVFHDFEDFHHKFKLQALASFFGGPGKRRLDTALTEKQLEPTEHSDKSEPIEKEPENSENAEGSENATEKSEPTENVTEKILQMNGKVINITGRLGDEQLEDWVIGGVDQLERVFNVNSVNAMLNVVNGNSSNADQCNARKGQFLFTPCQDPATKSSEWELNQKLCEEEISRCRKDGELYLNVG